MKKNAPPDSVEVDQIWCKDLLEPGYLLSYLYQVIEAVVAEEKRKAINWNPLIRVFGRQLGLS
jgi:hypothetical protein